LATKQTKNNTNKKFSKMSFHFFNAFDDFFDDQDNVAWSVVPLRLFDQESKCGPPTKCDKSKCQLAKKDRWAMGLARMDVVESETECTVKMELPGISKENVHVHFDDETNILTVEAERKEEFTSGTDETTSPETTPEASTTTDTTTDTTTATETATGVAPKPFHHYKERYYGHIKRSMVLPRNVDGENVNASLENGILKMVFAKKLEKETKKMINIM
jgi:HSP20 family molecular chaperone IbpA